jgi:hypothetical protein
VNAALRFRLVLALLLVGAALAFNVFSTDRALWQSPAYMGGGALIAGGIALVLARWVQRGDSSQAPRWRIGLLTVALAMPLLPMLLALLPWLLVAFNDTPRSVEAQLVNKEPVKGCGMKVWLRGRESATASWDGAERELCLDGVASDRSIHAGDAVRLTGRESWAGFVIDRIER